MSGHRSADCGCGFPARNRKVEVVMEWRWYVDLCGWPDISPGVQGLVASRVESDCGEWRNPAAPAHTRERSGCDRQNRGDGQPIVCADHVSLVSRAAGRRGCRGDLHRRRVLIAASYDIECGNKVAKSRKAPQAAKACPERSRMAAQECSPRREPWV